MLFGLVLVTAISAAPLDARPKSLLFAAKATVPTSHAAHASHYADLQAAATTRSAVVAHKLTLMVDHKEVASKQVNGHTDIASSYQAKYAEVTARLDAQKKLCEDCKIAEDELITALQTATEKHTTAQGKSEAHVAAVSAHTAAEVQWNDKLLEFLAKKGDMTYSALTVNSADSAFEACVSIVGELKVLAGEERSLEAYMTTKKGVMDTAKAEYDAAAVEATTADQAVTTMQGARAMACTGLTATPAKPSPNVIYDESTSGDAGNSASDWTLTSMCIDGVNSINGTMKDTKYTEDFYHIKAPPGSHITDIRVTMADDRVPYANNYLGIQTIQVLLYDNGNSPFNWQTMEFGTYMLPLDEKSIPLKENWATSLTGDYFLRIKGSAMSMMSTSPLYKPHPYTIEIEVAQD